VRRLGRYELRAPIGRGGMSAVYLGYDPMLDREVAIKILPANLAKEEMYRKRFLEEARALGRLDHQNLIRIYAVGQEGKTSYYAMELVRGVSLRQAIHARRRLRMEEALAVFRQYMAGLAAIHKAGIVHRDIKPGNIMLGESGRVVLMDFGLARRADRQAITAAGSVLGTPEYMSPEQARGDRAEARSDLYSAGVVLYEMLAGGPPFRGRDTLAILRQHVEVPAPPVSSLVPEMPRALEKTLGRLLAKKEDERPADADAAVRELKPLLPDARRAEEIVRGMVAEVSASRKEKTPASTKVGEGRKRSDGRPKAVPRAGAGAATAVSPWVPWGAMATAVLAMCVAVLALFRPSAPPPGEVWRAVEFRDGRMIKGRLERLESLPDGDATMLFRMKDGATARVKASDIRKMVRRRPLPWMELSAALVAVAALAVALAVVVQSRKARVAGGPPRAG